MTQISFFAKTVSVGNFLNKISLKLMYNYKMLETIKKDLNNFPDEVIKLWIEPYACDIGWPPENQRWLGILFAKDLNFWKKVKWEKKEIDLINVFFSFETRQCLEGMENAYIKKEKNGYSTISNGETRFLFSLKYLMEHGSFPEPLCLLFENGEYSIVDGHHRTLAWKSYGTIMKVLKHFEENNQVTEAESFKETARRKWQIKELAPFLGKQEVWVAVGNIL